MGSNRYLKMIKRLWRDVKFQKGWIIALVILIGLSSSIYASFRSTYDSGIKSFDRAKLKLNTADITIHTVPGKDYSSRLSKVSGVYRTSSAFVTDTYTLIKDVQIQGVISGVDTGNRVNNYFILRGKDFHKRNEVVVEHHYADKHNLKIGQSISLYINGQATAFKVSGICFSPNYIYLISPEGMVEDDFGAFFTSKEDLSKVVNTFYLKADADSDINRITNRIDEFFSQQQVGAVIRPANKTFADTAFKEDLGAMNTLANLFSFLLLSISAFTLFVVLSRVINRKRHEIGTLRAMGFSKWDIFIYYQAFSMVAVILGIIISIPIGLWLLSLILGYWGVTVLAIPGRFISYSLNFSYVIIAAILTFVFAIIGAFLPSYRAASLAPAEAMRPFITSGKSARIMSRSLMAPTKKLIFRDLFGYRARSLSTIISIALVTALEFSMVLSMSSYIVGAKQRFDQNEIWNIKVNFTKPEQQSTLNRIKHINGVAKAEPYSEEGAEIAFKNKNTIIQLSNLTKDTKMHRFQLEKGDPKSRGIIISGDVAYRLKVDIGDKVALSTAKGKKKTKIAGITSEFGSSEGYILKNMAAFNGALLKVDKGKMKAVEKSLSGLSFVKLWVLKKELRDGWLTLLNNYYGMVYAMDVVNVVLVLIAVGVFAFISTLEREWEYVIIKSMGFSNKLIISGSLVETFMLSVVGVLLGLPLGVRFAAMFNDTFKNLMSAPPIVLIPTLVISRSMMIIVVSLITVFLISKLSLKRNVAQRLRRVFETM